MTAPSRLASAISSSSSSSSPSAERALSLYRSLLRAARSLPAQQDRESLEEETKRRFRAERVKRGGESGGGGGGDGGGGGGGGKDGDELALPALLDEAEARLHDARHHGIPFARLEHAAQIPRAVLESARRLLRSDDEEGGGVSLPRDKGARAKLEAAIERRRVKRRQQQQQQQQQLEGGEEKQ
jgi:hypothetical protein